MKRRSKNFLVALGCGTLMAGAALAQISPGDLQKLEKAAPAQATARPKQPRKLLVFTRAEGYVHSSIPYAARALALMGEKTGAFTTFESADMSAFAPENLRQFDAVLFASTSELAFADLDLRRSLMDFVKSGRGIIGIHAATDNFYNWPEAADMMGGHFDGHPWQAHGTWAVKVVDPKHPLTAAFHGHDFKVNDEIYRIRQRSLRRTCRVLLALDATDKINRAAEGVRFSDRDLPISWVRSFGEGRIFYSAFGHNHSIYWNPAILRHYLDGIQFALGDLPVDTAPLPFDAASSFGAGEIDALFDTVAGYQYGQSREALVNLNEYLRLAAVSSKLRQHNEKRLLALLAGNTTLAGKQFVCEQLSLLGTKASVPQLERMLQDSATSDMARLALERIPGAAADEALRRQLSQTTGLMRIGIINTIAQRRDAKAISLLRKLATAPDSLAATAALTALGRIGGEEACAVLASIKNQAPDELREAAAHAYLNCGHALFEQGSKDMAFALFTEMNAAPFSEPVRYAALRGMMRSHDGDAGELLLRLLKNPETQSLAAPLASEIPPAQSVAGITQALPEFAPATQAQLLITLAERRDKEARQAAIAASRNEHAEIRAAAVQALGKAGDETTVLLLAEIAAGGGAEAAMARKSLYRLAGASVDETIAHNIVAVEDTSVKIELIRAANQRRIQTAAPALLQTAQAPAASVRLESMQALRSVAGEQHVPDLVDLLINAANTRERSALEEAVTAAAMKAPAEKRSSEIVARLRASSAAVTTETRESLLKILGGLGEVAALPILLAALDDTSAQVKTAAIVALSDWPTAEPANNLLAIAENSRHSIHQILALRGFVRLLRFESPHPGEETVEKYRRALALASNRDEQKMVLGWLAEVRSLNALELAMANRQNENLRPESERAAVKIAAAVSGSHPAETKALLQQLLEGAPADTLPHLQQARALIHQIEHFEDYLTAWLVAGPYYSPAGNFFEFEFPPEQPGQEVKWQIMPASLVPGQPWLLQLDRVLGGENCAAYLYNHIWSEEERRVRMELGSDDGVKVWLNGELVHANNISRGVAPGDDVFEISLRRGWNPLLLKITQGGGGWGACARLRDLNGGRLAGLKTALPPP